MGEDIVGRLASIPMFTSHGITRPDEHALLATMSEAAAEITKLRAEVGAEQAWRDDATERMQALGEKYGCLPGSNRLDWIEQQFAQQESRLSAIIGVMASLAAAISLLERTPKAKKAAPSDKMFDQMVVDYKASLERARGAIRSLELSGQREAGGEEKVGGGGG